LESNDEDEKDDIFSIKPNINMKKKGQKSLLKPSPSTLTIPPKHITKLVS
jgi:hypothetical protein